MKFNRKYLPLLISTILVVSVAWYVGMPANPNGTAEPNPAGLYEDIPYNIGSVAAWQIQGVDDSHKAKGMALLLRESEEQYLLRLQELEMTSGPDLYVYLTRNADGTLNNGYLDLGPLKSTIGSHNYAVPARDKPQEYEAVVIWSRTFNTRFAVGKRVAG